MNPLTDAEKVEIRRFCGYPLYGAAPTGMQGWRYFQVYGLLEFRLTNLSASEISVVRRYVSTLLALEMAVPASADHLDTDQASVWTRNKDELGDRLRLFDGWRRRLCDFLGVAGGPGLSSGMTRLVV